MIKFINNLRDGNIIPVDLMLHYALGVIIGLSCFLYNLNTIKTVITCFIIAVLIEIYDGLFKSKFSWKDIWFTLFGLANAYLIKILIYLI